MIVSPTPSTAVPLSICSLRVSPQEMSGKESRTLSAYRSDLEHEGSLGTCSKILETFRFLEHDLTAGELVVHVLQVARLLLPGCELLFEDGGAPFLSFVPLACASFVFLLAVIGRSI